MEVGVTISCFFFVILVSSSNGLLYPQDSETRDLKSLDGTWNFRLQPSLEPTLGFDEEW